jgi:hypothetical protein
MSLEGLPVDVRQPLPLMSAVSRLGDFRSLSNTFLYNVIKRGASCTLLADLISHIVNCGPRIILLVNFWSS